MINTKETLIGEINEKNTLKGEINVGVQFISPNLIDLEVTPNKEEQVFNHDGEYGYNEVKVNPIPEEYIIPNGTLDITENGNKDVTNYSSVNVSVESQIKEPNLQDKLVEIKENGITNIKADEGFDGLNNVDVTVNVEGGDDMIKYSTEEQVVGTWIDGRPVYRKVVNFGALPNGAEKEVKHGINNLDFVIKTDAFAYSYSSGFFIQFALPLSSTVGLDSCIYILIYGDKISIGTGKDRRNFTNCYVTLEYVKTTD